MKITHLFLWALACASASINTAVWAQASIIQPASDDTIIERLGPRLSKPATATDIVPAVRQAITLARQTADPRYLGQAQALIGAQWGSPKASYDIATLQATIEQSRHEFTQALATLKVALSQPAPSHAQAWLTVAAIERVQGRYAQAEQACKSINTPAAQFYARACLLETISLQGQWDAARQGFEQLLREQRLPLQQAWLQSLMAENELRAGQNAAALKHFAISLALDNDGYTALAYADALLAQQQAAVALQALQNQPSSDAVLIRRAQAYKQLQDPRWRSLADELQQRFAAAALRAGKAQAQAHAREQALFALQVQGNASAALQFAQSNLQLQREPIDWLIAVQSASQAGQSAEAAKLKEAAAKSGLKDARLL